MTRKMRILMNGVKSVITHSGRMHMDDFLSVALAIQFIGREKVDRGMVSLRRAVPSPEELSDPSVLIFDVGMRNEPCLLNFDHHGLQETTASFKLFLEALDYWEKFSMAHPWAERIAIIDHHGPRGWAGSYGVPEGVLPSLNSPVEAAVKALGSEGFEAPGMLDILDLVGRHCVDELKEMENAIEEIETAEKELVTSGGIRGVLFEGTVKGAGFAAAFSYLAKKKGWHFSVTSDDRGGGWAIYRFHDSPEMDLKRLDGLPDIMFAHQSGFLVKTRNKHVDLNALIEKAAGNRPVRNSPVPGSYCHGGRS